MSLTINDVALKFYKQFFMSVHRFRWVGFGQASNLWVRFGQVWVLKKKTQPKLTQSQKGFKLGQWVWIFFLKKISK